MRKFDSVKFSHIIRFSLMHRVDDLDIRIFKELGNPDSLHGGVRETYQDIAVRLGVDEETVRRRLKSAERLGSLSKWKIMVNPSVIGFKAVNVLLSVGDDARKTGAIAELSKIDGVVKILDFRGRKVLLSLYYQDTSSLNKKMEVISSICNCQKPIVWELVFPEPQICMTKMDWKIIGFMLEDVRKNLKRVSESVGVSVRTVERRLNKINEGRALYLQGTPNLRLFAGVSCVFIVFCSDEKEKCVVDHAILSKAKRIEIVNTSSRQYSTFAARFDNLAEADDLTDWIGGLNGVQSVSMEIMKELVVVREWLQKQIVKRQPTR